IAGNMGDGIRVGGGSTGTQIYSNTIGLRKGGAQEEANAGNGINVTDTASNTTIGGTAAGRVNIISGNAGHGINIDVNTVNTRVLRNNIGLDAGQTVGLGNGGDAVHVLGKGVEILGYLKGANSVIAGNAGNGILISGATASGTLVQGFRIGTNGAGTAAIPNELAGILVTTSADKVTLGAPVAGGGNLVSGNAMNGIHVVSSTGTLIQSNLVGTDRIGEKALGNTLAGIFLDKTTSVTVGGSVSDAGNTVSANGRHGIVVSDAASTLIGFNLVGVSADPRLNIGLGNTGDGVFVTGASTAPMVDNNQIASNTLNGVEFGVNATGLTLTCNNIGKPRFPSNTANNTGVLLSRQKVTVGGTTSSQANTISGNQTVGIDVQGTARNVGILGNYIGTGSGGATSLGNGTDGIRVAGLAMNVTIGGTASGAGNVISGNQGNGIHLQNTTQPLQILGNLIGTSFGGKDAIPNALDGIRLDTSSKVEIRGNTISGTAANAANL